MLSASSDNTTNTKDFLLQLDDETDDRKSISSIDNTAHQFLNFSRKVTEASSMRKPVDIQLGIACGKDLLFNSPSRILRRQQQQQQQPLPSSLSYNNNKASLLTPPTTPPLPLVRNNSIKKSNHSKKETVIQLPLSSPIITSPRPTYSLSINNNDTTTTTTIIPDNHHRPSPLLSPPQSQQQQQQRHTNNKPTTTSHHYPSSSSSSSPLLDRLVADVLNHIESCPDQSAYSDDLDRLKPKLRAYSITRHSSLKTQ